MRLFRQHGYQSTTVNQIAEAAQVSESTLFRYFPTKEDLVLWDDLNPLIRQALRAQPTTLGPTQALCAAVRQVFSRLPNSDRTQLRERVQLILTIPPIRASILDQVQEAMRTLAEDVAERTGQQPSDTEVRTVVGAVLGAALSTLFAAADDPTADVADLMNKAMAHLEERIR